MIFFTKRQTRKKWPSEETWVDKEFFQEIQGYFGVGPCLPEGHGRTDVHSQLELPPLAVVLFLFPLTLRLGNHRFGREGLEIEGSETNFFQLIGLNSEIFLCEDSEAQRIYHDQIDVLIARRPIS